MADATRTYLLVDGENIDGALGRMLGGKPTSSDRPRWQELTRFASEEWGQPVHALFFINAGPNATNRPIDSVLLRFVQALLAMNYQPILLSGRADEKVVDVGIKRTLGAILERSGDVLLASHDGDFAEEMGALKDHGRRVGVLGFDEHVSHQLREAADGIVFDLEDRVDAFEISLPRVRVIALDHFDPERYL